MSQRSHSRRGRASVPCEALEPRRLLSTINWVNRGGGDNFDAVYGANAALARTIVDRVIGEWQTLITNFNYSDGSNTFNLSLSAGALPSSLASTGGWTFLTGKPTGAQVTVDGDGHGAGWYFDPHPGTAALPDDWEFDAWQYNSPTTSLIAATTSSLPSAQDFYRVVNREVPHALGLVVGVPGARINMFLTNTGLPDPHGGGGTIWTYDDGGGVVTALTSVDGTSLYEGPTIPSLPNARVTGVNLLNPERTITTAPVVRRLMGGVETEVLLRAYGYSWVNPTIRNTFAIQYNEVTGAVRVTGDPSPGVDNTVNVSVSGSDMLFKVWSWTERVPTSRVGAIDITTGDGNDSVRFDSIGAGPTAISIETSGGFDLIELDRLTIGHIPVQISCGAGNDRVYQTNGLAGDLTVSGGSGSDLVSIASLLDTTSRSLTLTSSGLAVRDANNMPVASYHPASDADQFQFQLNNQGAKSVQVLSTLPGLSYDIYGGGGTGSTYTFTVGAGDLASVVAAGAALYLNGGSGGSIVFDDTLNPAAGGAYYQLNGGAFTNQYINSLTVGEGAAARTVSYNVNGPVRLKGSASAGSRYDVFRRYTLAGTLTIDAGAGDDSFHVGNGNLTPLRLQTIVNAGAGNDSVHADDDFDTGNDSYTLTANSLTKSSFDPMFDFGGLQYSGVEALALTGNRGNNTITVNGTLASAAYTVSGGAGDDAHDVRETAVAGAPLLLTDAAGAANTVSVNADLIGTASVAVAPSAAFSLAQVNVNGKLRFTGDATVGSLQIARGQVSLVPGDHVLRVMQLAVLIDGWLDLIDGNLLVDYAGSSPLEDVGTYLANGRNGGNWLGTGGIRSGAANILLGTALGVAEAADLPAGVLPGQPRDATTLVVRWTREADADLDRAVGLADFASMSAHFGEQGTGRWRTGDFNYDRSVDVADFAALTQNFNRPPLGPAAVPANWAGGAVGRVGRAHDLFSDDEV